MLKLFSKINKTIPDWALGISLGFTALVILISKITYPDMALGVILFPFIISFICGYLNSNLALKIKKNVAISYFIGFIFGLIGLGFYFMYYVLTKRK